MPIDEKGLANALAWLKNHNVSCGACKGRDFMVNQEFFVVHRTSPTGINLNNPTPLVAVVCDNCQHVMLFAMQPNRIVA